MTTLQPLHPSAAGDVKLRHGYADDGMRINSSHRLVLRGFLKLRLRRNDVADRCYRFYTIFCPLCAELFAE
jgi:hypothetical protein